jgi:predicted nucleic acid-binding protein
VPKPALVSIDSFGWLERLIEGPKAGEYNRLIDSLAPKDIVTSVVTVYEVYRKLRPIRGEAIALEAVVPLRATRLVPIDDQMALEAADYSLSLGLHFSDSLIYATARRYGAELHTSDPDLKTAPGVVFH